MDLKAAYLTTFAAFAGANLPTDRVIDGVDIRPLFIEIPGIKYDEERPIAFYNWSDRSLFAVRSGRWKLVFPHSYETVLPGDAGADGANGSYTFVNAGLVLFDMENDPGETTNVLPANPNNHPAYPGLVEIANQFRVDLGDNLTSTSPGPKTRPIGNGQLLPSVDALVLGDLNDDGQVNLLDVEPFVELLTTGTHSFVADFDGDCLVNLLDVGGFVDALTGD